MLKKVLRRTSSTGPRGRARPRGTARGATWRRRTSRISCARSTTDRFVSAVARATPLEERESRIRIVHRDAARAAPEPGRLRAPPRVERIGGDRHQSSPCRRLSPAASRPSTGDGEADDGRHGARRRRRPDVDIHGAVDVPWGRVGNAVRDESADIAVQRFKRRELLLGSRPSRGSQRRPCRCEWLPSLERRSAAPGARALTARHAPSSRFGLRLWAQPALLMACAPVLHAFEIVYMLSCSARLAQPVWQ